MFKCAMKNEETLYKCIFTELIKMSIEKVDEVFSDFFKHQTEVNSRGVTFKGHFWCG